MKKEQLSDDVTLYCGDCLEVLPTLGKGTIDCIVTDPPYGKLGLDGICTPKLYFADEGGSLCDLAELVRCLEKVTSACMAPGVLRWSIGECGANILARSRWDSLSTTVTAISKIIELKTWNSLMRLLTSGGTPGVIKMATAAGGSHAAHAGLPSWLTQTTTYPIADVDTNVKRAAFAVLSETSSVGAWRREVIGASHPTPKPVELAAHFIGLHSATGDVILDPFCGHGWVGVAAVHMDRKFIGVEIDQTFFSIACQRISRELAQPKLAIEFKPEPQEQNLDL